VPDRELHIGIDARELGGHPTGVGRYLAGLLQAWSADSTLRYRFTLFVPDGIGHPASGIGQTNVIST